MKTIIADDDPLVRRMLRDVLQEDGFIVVAEASTGREAVELALHYRPQLLVVDLVMPQGDGLSVIQRLHAAGADDIRMVMLTTSEDDEMALSALRAGASGFLTKDLAITQLARALRAAAHGEPVISRRLEQVLIDRLRATPETRIGVRPVRSRLTPREWEVLDLLCTGMTVDGIARELVLTTETIRSHLKHVRRKLDVKTTADAVAMAPALREPYS